MIIVFGIEDIIWVSYIMCYIFYYVGLITSYFTNSKLPWFQIKVSIFIVIFAGSPPVSPLLLCLSLSQVVIHNDRWREYWRCDCRIMETGQVAGVGCHICRLPCTSAPLQRALARRLPPRSASSATYLWHLGKRPWHHGVWRTGSLSKRCPSVWLIFRVIRRLVVISVLSLKD